MSALGNVISALSEGSVSVFIFILESFLGTKLKYIYVRTYYVYRLVNLVTCPYGHFVMILKITISNKVTFIKKNSTNSEKKVLQAYVFFEVQILCNHLFSHSTISNKETVIEEMFPQYYMHSDVYSILKYLTISKDLMVLFYLFFMPCIF